MACGRTGTSTYQCTNYSNSLCYVTFLYAGKKYTRRLLEVFLESLDFFDPKIHWAQDNLMVRTSFGVLQKFLESTRIKNNLPRD
jgi:hypothetical protein